MLPHLQIVKDAMQEGPEKPHLIYVVYSSRLDRDRLVKPSKIYDVAEHVVRNAPCNVVIVKETMAEMLKRTEKRKKLWGV